MKIARLTSLLLFLFFFNLAASCEDSDTRDQSEGGGDGDGDGDSDNGEAQTQADCTPEDTVVSTNGQLRVDAPFLVNACGDYVQLRGVSSMWLNWETNGYAESKDSMSWMIKNWNISLFRAAMGVDAANGYMYNPSKAKGQVKTIVENAIDLGIYVIIDWHSHTATETDQQEEAIAFFTEMAETYGKYPNVIYEIFNEPENQDWVTEIKPYHEAVVSAIRKIDPDNIIIMGTPSWCQYPDVADANPVEGDNLMYTVHFYSCEHQQDLMAIANNALFKGVPIFITEWGATMADGGVSDKTVCDTDADRWLDWADDNSISWAAWKFDNCTDASCLLAPGAPVDGPFSADVLQGHGPYVVQRLLK